MLRSLLNRSASRRPTGSSSGRTRALRASVTAVVAASLLATPAVSASAASTRDPAMFGAGGSTASMIRTNERLAGQKVRGARVYKKWDTGLFGASQRWARDTGHTLFVSIKSERRGGADVKWRAIANARRGSTLYRDMQRQAAQIKGFKAKVYIAFNHEPEARGSWKYGDGGDFKAAWRKLISVYRAEGVRNAEYVWNVTAWGFVRKDSRRAQNYYPGDAYVDHIAADGYNWYRCRKRDGQWKELKDIIEGQRQFGRQHPSKGLMLWEFGSAEDAKRAGRKAQWLRNARELFTKPGYQQYNALLSWEGRAHDSNLNCRFDFNSSSSARRAWAEWNAHPSFRATSVT